MWAVLTAVLGGAYLAGKMSSERSASKEATQKREEWKRLLDEWCVNITDERLESRLETYIQRNPFEAAEKAKSRLSVSVTAKKCMKPCLQMRNVRVR